MQFRYEAKLVSGISNCWSVWDYHSKDWRSPTVDWTGADAEEKCQKFVEQLNQQAPSMPRQSSAPIEAIVYTFTDSDRDDPTQFFEFMHNLLGDD